MPLFKSFFWKFTKLSMLLPKNKLLVCKGIIRDDLHCGIFTLYYCLSFYIKFKCNVSFISFLIIKFVQLHVLWFHPLLCIHSYVEWFCGPALKAWVEIIKEYLFGFYGSLNDTIQDLGVVSIIMLQQCRKWTILWWKW